MFVGIIFEGPDASGKSTLARKVRDASGKELYLAGGKPKDDAEMWPMIRDQQKALERGALVDRVSSISQQVYREGLFFRPDLMNEAMTLVTDGHLLVYCRPPDTVLLDPSKHEWKPYDTDEWKQTILGNQPTYIQRYDLLMSKFPCIIYDWTSEESTHIEQLLADITSPGVGEALQQLMGRQR